MEHVDLHYERSKKIIVKWLQIEKEQKRIGFATLADRTDFRGVPSIFRKRLIDAGDLLAQSAYHERIRKSKASAAYINSVLTASFVYWFYWDQVSDIIASSKEMEKIDTTAACVHWHMHKKKGQRIGFSRTTTRMRVAIYKQNMWIFEFVKALYSKQRRIGDIIIVFAEISNIMALYNASTFLGKIKLLYVYIYFIH